ncbi:hypothetical protein [Nocardioides sp. B-3]|uniref:hypothetical protein n=1 Tax=Nocardioides sp. B-3 TaxID=2895565 RepID=UPI0021533B4B|nr:hypothetical protein [Nocardioides sp. B-3]UUZ61922.1 hypothetical protein LP418_01360 [Nocardioides sp. B-3]
MKSLRRPARLDSFVRRRVFQRSGTRHGADVTTYALERPGALLRGRVVHGEQPDALLYLGGNAEHVTRWGDRFREHVPHRATYLVAYRGYGASTGEPSERAIVDDALAVYDELRTRHGRVAVLGAQPRVGRGSPGRGCPRRRPAGPGHALRQPGRRDPVAAPIAPARVRARPDAGAVAARRAVRLRPPCGPGHRPHARAAIGARRRRAARAYGQAAVQAAGRDVGRRVRRRRPRLAGRARRLLAGDQRLPTLSQQ